ncbi:MAG: efflux RND transporter permease subunit [Acidobacteria bacterium]|nr:MAG: efflux RND transporter permease subunit [Acidobacteriota bacterium]
MLSAIVRTALRRKGIILALAAALLGYGVYTLTRAKYDVFPEFAPPVVSIQTEAPGLSPEQVELLVTQPIEFAINGVTGIQSLMSKSIQGISLVNVVFEPNSNVYLDRQLVAEQLATVETSLPAGVHAPIMTPLTSSTADVLELGLTSETRSLMQLRTVADWVVRPTLRAVPGVANVSIFGGQVKQYQVQFIPQRLVQYDLSVNDVLAAARRATGLRGAGFIETANQRFILHPEGQSVTAGELASTVLIHENGANVTLGQVAHVVEGPAPPIGAATVMGKPGIILAVSEQYGANTLQVTQSLDDALNGLRPALARQGIRVYPALFRPANFIETALSNIRSSLTTGAILVIVVIFLFLFDFRTAAISCTAIPLSLLAAVTVMEHMGFTLNTMTLGGLAIAIGEVVDDAVIDVENILRRLRENRHAENPRPAIRVVFDASIEVRSAVVYATFAVVLVFIPILMMSGIPGALFRALGTAYILSVLASLLVALTVTPVLSMTLLSRKTLAKEEPPFVRWLKAGYRRVLMVVERAPVLVIAGATVLTVLGLAALPTFRSTFLPDFAEGHYIVHMTDVPGTSLNESVRIGNQVTAALLKVPYVRRVAQKAGRAALLETRGPYASEIGVDLKPGLNGKQNRAALAGIRQAIKKFPGLTFTVNTFLAERMEEILSGYTAAVVLNIYGPNLDVLDQESQRVANVLRSVPGARAVQIQSPPGTPQVAIKLRHQRLARWGFDPLSAFDAIQTAFGGLNVGQVYQSNQVFNVTVVLDPAERQDPPDVASLLLQSPAGNYVSLGQLADVYETSGRYVILHNGGRRVQTITLNVSGRAVNSFVQQAQQEIQSKVKLPADTYFEFTGTAQAQAKSRRQLMVNSVLAGLLIILLLSIVMMNYRNLLLVLANLPFALVGGILAVFITSRSLSLGSLIGFITLFGITLRNSIMLISHYEHLVSEEGMSWGLEAAIRGASERLAPILMTATVTGLGLLPLAIGSGDPGREIEGPMAIVILGGLLTSTALNLLVLPTLALRFGKFEKAIELGL